MMLMIWSDECEDGENDRFRSYKKNKAGALK